MRARESCKGRAAEGSRSLAPFLSLSLPYLSRRASRRSRTKESSWHSPHSPPPLVSCLSLAHFVSVADRLQCHSRTSLLVRESLVQEQSRAAAWVLCPPLLLSPDSSLSHTRVTAENDMSRCSDSLVLSLSPLTHRQRLLPEINITRRARSVPSFFG